MSQTQPTIEKIHSLRKKTRDSVKKSYPYRLSRRHLFLIIALHRHATKIYDGHSRRCEIHRYGTRYVVYTYIIILIGSAIKMKMPLWAIPAGVLGSLLPFGPFIFDHLLKKNLQENVSKEA